jgi:hypothetical protein
MDGGFEVLLWEGTDPATKGPTDFVVTPGPEVQTRAIRIYLQTERVPGWDGIDAVELVGTDGSRQWATEASASSYYGQGGAAAMF